MLLISILASSVAACRSELALRALTDDPDRGESAMPLMLYDEPTADWIRWPAPGSKI